LPALQVGTRFARLASVHPFARLLRAAPLLALATQGACVSGAADYPTAGPPLFTQYIVTDMSDAKSNDCFYGCLRWSDTAARETCLGQCEGVVASVTSDPCSPVVTSPCTYVYDAPVLSASASNDDDDDGRGLFGSIVGAIFDAALAPDRSGESHHETSRESRHGTPRAQVASRSSPPERPAPPARRYRVAHPEPGGK